MSINRTVDNGINFLVNAGSPPININKSDLELGFFGMAGGSGTLEPNQWLSTNYLVDNTSSDVGTPVAQTSSVCYQAPGSGLIDGEIQLPLRSIPNYQATLNIRFKQESNINVLAARCNMFNGVDVNTPPVGMDIRIAEIAHVGTTQTGGGLGDTAWQTASSGENILLVNNPGPSGSIYGGYSPLGHSEHDWYIALSVNLNQVGGKSAGLNVYLEYL